MTIDLKKQNKKSDELFHQKVLSLELKLFQNLKVERISYDG